MNSQRCEKRKKGGNVVVNIVRLREAMKIRSVSVEEAAKAIDVDRATFYRRLGRQGSKFTVEEVANLGKLLELSSREMQEIFFE